MNDSIMISLLRRFHANISFGGLIVVLKGGNSVTSYAYLRNTDHVVVTT